jgi:hypothetical protein
MTKSRRNEKLNRMSLAMAFMGVLAGTSTLNAACKARQFDKSEDSDASGIGRRKAPALALGQETFERGDEQYEKSKTAEIVDLSLKLMEKNGKVNGTQVREVHSKAHGCMRAMFKVDDDLPADWEVGVFRKGAIYPTWARASNGAPGVGKDSERQTSRGFALKLMGIDSSAPRLELLGLEGKDGGLRKVDNEKRTQDFLLVNGRRFFIRDLETYARFLEASNNEKTLTSFLSINPLKWPQNGAMFLALLERTRLKIANPLEVPYFSAVPYSFNHAQQTGAAKYKIEPCNGSPEQVVPKDPADSYLRDAMRKTLSAGGACYRFLVLRQVDAAKQPIEDSTVEWKVEETESRAVATLTIPKQDFEAPDVVKTCEDMSFHPWHGLEAHRPLGQMGLCHEADQSRRPRREPTQWTCGSMRRPSPMGNDDWSAS